MNMRILEQHLADLSNACDIEASRDLRRVKVKGVLLPPGWNRSTTAVLLEIPEDYPLSPPGAGSSRLYLEPGLRFNGRTPSNYHDPGFLRRRGWAWWCYSVINWDPKTNDLIDVIEMLRTDMTHPT